MATEILLGTAQGLRAVGGATVALEGRRVTALVSAGEGWLAVAEHRTVVDDAGSVRAEVPGAAVTCVTGYGSGALVGTEDAGLLRIDGGSVSPVEGFADAEGRSSWYTPWGGPPSTQSVATAPDGTPYVNVHVGGILRSRDGGKTWQQTIDVDVDVHQVVADRSGVLLAACGAEGLAVSRDGGDSWRLDTAGLHATYCRAVAVAGDTVLVSAAMGPRGGRAAVYRRPLDDDGEFERCTAGLPSWFDDNIDTYRLDGRGDLAAFASADGRVFVSHDAGASWDEADRADRVAALAVR
jgi:photosystem II stability/assembly factor-like uncharacterized protein